MIILDNSQAENKGGQVVCQCEKCCEPFIIRSSIYRSALKGNKNPCYCSNECKKGAKVQITLSCEQCLNPIVKIPSALKTHNFCSQSCAAIFANAPRKKDKYTYKNCKYCNKSYARLKKYKSKGFCTLKCSAQFKIDTIIQNWLSGKITGYTKNYYLVQNTIRNYLLKLANYCCTRCKWNQINPITNKCPLQINHIDGNAKNCHPDNLEVICPNCHSLTSNFGGLNRNKSPRKYRHLKLEPPQISKSASLSTKQE